MPIVQYPPIEDYERSREKRFLNVREKIGGWLCRFVIAHMIGMFVTPAGIIIVIFYAMGDIDSLIGDILVASVLSAGLTGWALSLVIAFLSRTASFPKFVYSGHALVYRCFGVMGLRMRGDDDRRLVVLKLGVLVDSLLRERRGSWGRVIAYSMTFLL